jgi:cell division protein FtsW (lipid II flippase)
MAFAADLLHRAPARPDGEDIIVPRESLTTMSSLRLSVTAPPLSRLLALPAALGLLAVAVVHLVDGPASLSDQFYLGALQLALAAACVPLAVLLVTRPVRLFWHASGALCTAALLVYVASRTTGLPGSADDIHNWFQMIGVFNVFFEAAVIALAATVVLRRKPRPAA